VERGAPAADGGTRRGLTERLPAGSPAIPACGPGSGRAAVILEVTDLVEDQVSGSCKRPPVVVVDRRGADPAGR